MQYIGCACSFPEWWIVLSLNKNFIREKMKSRRCWFCRRFKKILWDTKLLGNEKLKQAYCVLVAGILGFWIKMLFLKGMSWQKSRRNSMHYVIFIANFILCVCCLIHFILLLYMYTRKMCNKKLLIIYQIKDINYLLSIWKCLEFL